MLELVGCYKIAVLCPKCGKQGFIFFSKKKRNRVKMRIYHGRGNCLVDYDEIKEQIEINR